MKNILMVSAVCLLTLGCVTQPAKDQDMAAKSAASDKSLSISYEKYKLDNGLTIILHQDKSDPIVAMATLVHVGSNREKPGRTGFAHFFEHMAFNDSENVPQGANRKMIEELGGTRNGGTWSDGTIYYEVVPKDALEKLMWIDSDRLGYMINTVTDGALEREKQVVKNEKRQRVDNQAYGHTDHVIRKNLYPESHPYNWTVIGDLEDLQNATLEDVKEFYSKYYGPDNATLVIAGDIDIDETKALVKRWFGEIKQGQAVPELTAQPVTLTESKRLFHLDTFAKVPEIRMTFPTVESYHPDSYALSALGEILSSGKRAALYKTLVEERKLAPRVAAYQRSSEIAGTFTLRARAHEGVDLDDLYSGFSDAMAQFEENGFSDKDLARIKARQETEFYQGISSVLDKAFQLGSYDVYAGSPDFITQDIENIKAVSREDIMRVYNTYVKGKQYVLTSFVPAAQPELIVDGSSKAAVVEEQIVEGAEEKFDPNQALAYEKTPTKHDRSEPPLGDTPIVNVPQINRKTAKNGLQVYNIEHNELPLVNFSLHIEGGAWLETPDNLGAANMLAELMNEGTRNKTPAQLEDAIGLLGAEINFSADINSIDVEGSTLARNYEATMALVAEMLLEPRWDAAEFERVKARELSALKQSEARPFTVALRGFNKQIYGSDHRAGMPADGTLETLSGLTLDNLKSLYQRAVTPGSASLHVVGDISQAEIMAGLGEIVSDWAGDPMPLPSYNPPKTIDKPKIYFVDIPDAKQSVIIAGKPAMKGNNPELYQFEVAQNRLGAGGSARLFQTLRIEKGYTYGAYSLIQKRHFKGPFLAYSQVRSNVTLESLQIFKELIGQYDETFTQVELDTTKNLLVKRNTRRFETLDNLIGILEDVSTFDLPFDFIDQQQQELLGMTVEQAKAIYQKYAEEQNMIYVVVGDAKTQFDKVAAFGYGQPVMLDRLGNPL